MWVRYCFELVIIIIIDIKFMVVFWHSDLAPVDDLVVYKKSIKYRLVGLRWYYSEDASIDGFIISINDEDVLGNTNNVSVIAPTRCSAWPKYYCHTYQNLNPINNFTFKVRVLIDSIKYLISYIMKSIGYKIMYKIVLYIR